MQHDFFVHCYDNNDREIDSKDFKEFIVDVSAKAHSSTNAISVSAGSTLDRIIQPNKRIYTIGYQLEITGKIDETNARNLREMCNNFNPKDSFRIHGAYLGKCTAEFAIQLYGLVYENTFWPDYPHFILSPVDRYKVQRREYHEMVSRLINRNAFLNSNIRYGTVFDDKTDPQINRREKSQNLTQQLTDDLTKIY